MAVSIITRAKAELERQRDRAKALKKEHQEEVSAMTQGAAVLTGAALAALVDKKFGEGGAPAEVGSVPYSAIGGGVAVVGAVLAKGMPFRRELAAAGLGSAATALYRLVYDNVEFD